MYTEIGVPNDRFNILDSTKTTFQVFHFYFQNSYYQDLIEMSYAR